MSARFPPLRAIVFGLACLLPLAGCDDARNFDVASQIGPDPVLPQPSVGLLPDLKVVKVVGWKNGQTPTVPDGLKVTAYAKDLVNPRTVYTLPNGDVLVVQSRAPPGKPLTRPKDVIRSWIMSIARGDSGGEPKESNLITLLRDTNRDGQVDERHDLGSIPRSASLGWMARSTSPRPMRSSRTRISSGRHRSPPNRPSWHHCRAVRSITIGPRIWR